MGWKGSAARIGLAAGLLAAACAPREATYDLTERAAAAPPPKLLPTSDFDAPAAGGAEAALRLGDDRAALAARAEALRGRAAALSASQPLTPAERDRLLAARPPAE